MRGKENYLVKKCFRILPGAAGQRKALVRWTGLDKGEKEKKNENCTGENTG